MGYRRHWLRPAWVVLFAEKCVGCCVGVGQARGCAKRTADVTVLTQATFFNTNKTERYRLRSYDSRIQLALRQSFLSFHSF
eukprot:3827684-Rhodomonas_salina.3